MYSLHIYDPSKSHLSHVFSFVRLGSTKLHSVLRSDAVDSGFQLLSFLDVYTSPLGDSNIFISKDVLQLDRYIDEME